MPEQHPARRRRWSPEAPATPIAALAVAVIAAGSDTTTSHHLLLALAVLIAVAAIVCDVINWRAERNEPTPVRSR